MSYICSLVLLLFGLLFTRIIDAEDGKDAVTCPSPPANPHGYIPGGPAAREGVYFPGDEVQLFCNPGSDTKWYHRYKVVICGEDGAWNDEITTCIDVSDMPCPLPELSEFSYLEGDESFDAYPEGSEVRIQCLTGYQLVGVARNQCTKDGWKYAFPECKGPSTPKSTQALTGCPVPVTFPHGTMLDIDDHELKPGNDSQRLPIDSTITFYCHDGLVLRGPKVVMCGDNGEWETNFPTCYRRVCSSPLYVPHGKWLGLRRSPGITAQIKCDHGYKLRNPNVQKLECRRASPPDLEWFGEQPVCVEKAVCSDPGSPRTGTGHRVPDTTYGTFYEGSEIRVTCNEGYNLTGSESIVCEIDGSWSAPRGKCKPEVTCSDLPVEPNGFFSVKYVGRSDYYFSNDEVELECNPGYKPNIQDEGSILVFCYDDGSWDEKIATCSPSTCPRPEISKHSFIEGDKEILATYPYNAHLKIRCPQGYQLLGTNWNRCTDHGWDFAFPYCKEITCPDPGVPEGGSREGPSGKYVINSLVTFNCFGGYIMSGSKQRTCQSNGQWDGSLTTCSQNIEGCKNPGIPISGHRFGNRFKTGDKVTFKCYPQYSLIGSEERECQPDGEWNGTETFCRGALDFDRPEDVKTQLLFDLDKKMVLKDSERPRMEAGRCILCSSSVYNEDTGGHLVFYFLFDSSKSVGTENFNTSIKFATALVKRVGVSSTVHIGAITYGKTVAQNIFPLERITEATVLKELKKIKEIGGGTSTKAALLMVRDTVATVHYAYPGWKPIKSTVFIITDAFHNIGGNPEDVATVLKKNGVEIFVIGLVGHAKRVKAGSFLALASSPKHVLYVNGYETMEYLVDVLLNNNTISYTRCGIRDREQIMEHIFGGRRSTIHWPWIAHLSITQKDVSVSCEGSILDDLWILTAAHCLKEGVKADDITVTIGTLDIEEDGEENRETHFVERIYQHPQFNERAHLDYDVAVLKLKRPIKFGKYIRRICLPPESEEIGQGSTLYREGQSATVIGFDRYDPKIRATSKKLKVVETFLQSNKTCVESLAKQYPRNYKELVTDSMMCAGDNEGLKDDCERNSGGPLMQVLRSEGDPYWVQVGVVSWGVPSKCRVKGYYGFYTNLARVVPWIYEVMAGKHV